MKCSLTMFVLPAAFALSACGGPGQSGIAYVGIFDADSSESSDLTILSFDPASSELTSDTETLNRNAGEVVLGGLAGSYDPDTGTITFDGGGIAQLNQTGTDYVATFLAEPVGADPFVGLIGQPTDNADMPSSGNLDYAGTNSVVMVIITDAGTTYDLTGDVAASVDLSTLEMDITLDALDGIRNSIASSSTGVTNIATLEITGVTVDGTSFSGGSAELTSSELGELTGTETVTTNGMFFGPDADEIGALLKVDDGATGDLVVQTQFTAD